MNVFFSKAAVSIRRLLTHMVCVAGPSWNRKVVAKLAMAPGHAMLINLHLNRVKTITFLMT
jgi:hypothetical protein